MDRIFVLLSVLLFFSSCIQDPVNEETEDSSVYPYEIIINASSSLMPLNEFGVSILTAVSERRYDITAETTFYVDGEKIEGNIFKPNAIGKYIVKGEYRGARTKEIELVVKEPRNRKVLIELFTSRRCVWCPWIAHRVDSLSNSNDNVVAYSIHGEDELTISEGSLLEELLMVSGRPSVRINRGYARRNLDPIEIQGLIDSVYFFLSHLTELELSINSDFNDHTMDVKVYGKFYEEMDKELYLTVNVVEDKIITENQYNGFSGHPNESNPFSDKPHPIPVYQNHNTLRKVLTDVYGEKLAWDEVDLEQPILIADIQKSFDELNIKNTEEAYIIAVVHERREGIDISSVRNAQIVKMGGDIGFDE